MPSVNAQPVPLARAEREGEVGPGVRAHFLNFHGSIGRYVFSAFEEVGSFAERERQSRSVGAVELRRNEPAFRGIVRFVDIGRSLHTVARSKRPNESYAFRQHLVVNGKCALVRAERFGVKRDGFLGVGRLAAFTFAAAAFAATAFAAAAFACCVDHELVDAKLTGLGTFSSVSSSITDGKSNFFCITLPRRCVSSFVYGCFTSIRRYISPAFFSV